MAKTKIRKTSFNGKREGWGDRFRSAVGRQENVSLFLNRSILDKGQRQLFSLSVDISEETLCVGTKNKGWRKKKFTISSRIHCCVKNFMK